MKKLIYLVLLMVALTFTNADAYLTKANWVGGTVNSTNILLDAETDNDTFDVLLDNNTNDFPNATVTVTVFGGACSRPSTCGTREIVKVKASSCTGTHPTRVCTLTVNARNQESTTHSGDWVAGSKVDLGATTGIMTEWETAIDLKVTGAASSTDNAIARFDGTTGKLVQDSGITIDDNRNILSNRGHLKFTQETTPGALTCALAGLGAGNVDNGTHYYKVTFVTANGETEAGTASLVVTVTDKTVNGQVALSAIPTGTSGVVTSRKIYRTKAGIASTGTYYLLTTITDNTTTTYTDNIADASLTTAHPISNTTAGGIYVGGNNRIQIDQIGTIFPDSIRLLETGSTPTLYTTIQSGDLTGAGITLTTPVTAGTLARVEDKLSAFAATTSAELYGVISDETGSASGSPLLVFNTNPTLTGATLTGHLLFTDNTYDIGASGATRPRTGYFGTSLFSPLYTGSGAIVIQPGIDSTTAIGVNTKSGITITPVVFTGSGLNDATSGGTFTGTSNMQYQVQIDGTGTPNTFSWSDNGASSWNATGVAITGSAQNLSNGVTITFGATTGHTLNDYWNFSGRIAQVIKVDTTNMSTKISGAMTSTYPTLIIDGLTTPANNFLSLLSVGGAATLQSGGYVQMGFGHADSSLGYSGVLYSFAPATGSPSTQFAFVPRNNADTESKNLAEIVMTKIAGEDSTTISFESAVAGSRKNIIRIDKTGYVGINTISPAGQFHIIPLGAAVIGQIIKGAASQSADLLQIQNSAATVLAAFGSAGIIRLATKTPANASDTGTTGMVAWDASYIYVCTTTNTWKRVAIATW